MRLPPGVPDPMFMHELALELGMTIGDLGRRASAHEVGVLWPAYFRARAREVEREERQQKMRR